MGQRLVELRSYHGTTPDAGYDIIGSPISLTLFDHDQVHTTVVDSIRVPMPGEPPTYSFVKNLSLYCAEAPGYIITNTKLYFKPRPISWNGVEVYIQTSGSYVNPVTQGQVPLTGFSNNASSFTLSNPAALAAQTKVVGLFGPWIQLQVRVTSAAVSGLPKTLPLSISWEEWTIP